MPSWRGAQLKKKAQGQIYLYLYRILIGQPEGKRPLDRPRPRWDNIKMCLGEIRWEDVN
jgi:hypothetical protein